MKSLPVVQVVFDIVKYMASNFGLSFQLAGLMFCERIEIFVTLKMPGNSAENQLYSLKLVMAQAQFCP